MTKELEKQLEWITPVPRLPGELRKWRELPAVILLNHPDDLLPASVLEAFADRVRVADVHPSPRDGESREEWLDLPEASLTIWADDQPLDGYSLPESDCAQVSKLEARLSFGDTVLKADLPWVLMATSLPSCEFDSLGDFWLLYSGEPDIEELKDWISLYFFEESDDPDADICDRQQAAFEQAVELWLTARLNGEQAAFELEVRRLLQPLLITEFVYRLKQGFGVKVVRDRQGRTNFEFTYGD